ncbi:MAG: hypothetical protein RIG77_17835 [Cyclobacteriaceae bacterium]
MRSKLLGFVFFSILTGLFFTHQSYGQLLEDRNKLKTEKATKKGFSLYKKKVIKRVPSGERHTDDRSVSPKYSQDREVSKSDRNVKPKYSRERRGRGVFRAITPRFSQDNAGKSSDRVVSPRYSKKRRAGKITIISPKYSIDVAGQGSDRAVYPKYSKERAGKGSDRAVYPKYSKDVAGQGSDRLVSPKYSRDIAGQGSDRYVQPRYSRQRAGQGVDRVVSPRYSRDIAGQGYGRVVSPKYSRDIAGQGSDRVVHPRYTRFTAGSGSDRVVRPRFSINPLYEYKYERPASASGPMVFEYPKVAHYKNRKKNRGEESWNGPWVEIKEPKHTEFAEFTGDFKKQKKGRHMHPSANYLFAKYNNSPIARDLMQKASILWVRVHMNQTDPKGVKKKAPKLKFDKEESEIWNNQEREYTKN